jgi:hypothetical protein
MTVKGAQCSQPIKRRARGPPFSPKHIPEVGSPGGAEHSTRAKIHFFLAFLAFLAFAFFAFFAFLAIVSSQGFHGLKRDTEACLAEGQPRNILDDNPSRFAGPCRVLSWRRHHVIHSCYAF